MSGIVGIRYLDGRDASSQVVRGMMAPLSHRGPDGQRAWCSGAVGLGHLMLHTTPESLSEQLPQATASGEVAITADVRLDNREELQDTLGLRRRAGDAVLTDSDLLLAAYERWGERCVGHLLGDYVFAIWDARRQTFFCARDHFGVRPFYYCHLPGRLFAFASEVKALLAIAEVPREINEVRIADLLVNLVEDAESTLYTAIQRLPAAHTMHVSTAGSSVKRYWQLEPISVPAMSDEAYAEGFRERFTEAVRCRLRSAHPVGAQLSGGLDSSYVACVARDVLREAGKGPLQTVSLVFDTVTESDERPYIQEVLNTGHFDPTLVAADDIGPITAMEEEYRYLDVDATGGSDQLVLTLLQASRDAGIRVLLDGVDGDTTVSHGVLYLRELARAGQWRRFRREVKAIAGLMEAADHTQTFEEQLQDPARVVDKYVRDALEWMRQQRMYGRAAYSMLALTRAIPGANRRVLARLYLKAMFGASRGDEASGGFHDTAMLNPAFAARTKIEERLQAYGTHFESSSVRAQQLSMFRSHMLPYVFELTNHLAAAYGVEERHPFMDKRLIEYCVSLPPEQSLAQGWTRAIMRRAMRGVVPERVRRRVGKANMEPSHQRGFELERAKLDAVLDTAEHLHPYVDTELLASFRSSPVPATRQGLIRLQKLVSLALLLRHVQKSTESVSIS